MHKKISKAAFIRHYIDDGQFVKLSRLRRVRESNNDLTKSQVITTESLVVVVMSF